MSNKPADTNGRSAADSAADLDHPKFPSRRWRRGFRQLLDARRYALDCGLPLWDFAVEITWLYAAGLTDNDLRWLIVKGHVEHAHETERGDRRRTRQFHPVGAQSFAAKSCFVLTDAGAAAFATPRRARSRPARSRPKTPPAAEPRSVVGSKSKRAIPHWNAVGRVLHVGTVLVKRFTVPAANQDIVLAAFQAQGWPECIDDPLPPAKEIDAKRRLHNTIIRLNRSHRRRLIRFGGNGKGRGIRWRRVDERH